jgi:hypothetical protein
MSLQIRLMREQDIAAVFEVQTQAYVSAMVEAESIFRATGERHRLPAGLQRMLKWASVHI